MTRAHRFVLVVQAVMEDSIHSARIRAIVIASALPEECVPRDLCTSALELAEHIALGRPMPTWLEELLERAGQTLQQFIDNA